MTPDIQLTIASYDETTPIPCANDPERNGYQMNCLFCPFSDKESTSLFCRKFNLIITARDKYSLTKWKKIRESILARDGYQCNRCKSTNFLHVHHIDGDPTNDAEDNLITLCERCHRLIHTGNYGEIKPKR